MLVSLRRSATRVAVLALLVGCAGIQVSSDWDPEFDFSRARSFTWLAGPHGESADLRATNELIDGRIREAIDAELMRRGYQKVEGSPDLLVGYHLAFEKKMSVTSVNSYYGYDPYWGPAGHWETRIREYDVGTLVIDVVEAGSNELVWRGWGKGRVRENSSPAQSIADIRAAVSKILERFPPTPGS